ncbi:hypothetical protein AAF712_003884 [Marasmius tenuissimus]|uniref:MAT1-1-1 n=1 Tax=Marasmius tenuissimus TaxID=585030 RepID=A0ABR3A4T4_9AGAR
MPILEDGKTLTRENFPTLFKVLLQSVLSIFHGEQLRTQDSGKEVVGDLIKQVTSYAYKKDPFNIVTTERPVKPLKYWNHLANDSNARLLAKVAIKVFSINPSKICDERTASRLGWFNAARRSSLTPENLVNSAKLYDYYVNGFDESPSPHRARVELSRVVEGAGNSAHIHSAPSLMDLINTDNVEPQVPTDTAAVEALEQTWFNHPDPYDLDETDRIDSALQQQTAAIPTITRSSITFDVAEYVQLKDSRLIALLTDVNVGDPSSSQAMSEAADRASSPAGTPGDWNVEDFI